MSSFEMFDGDTMKLYSLLGTERIIDNGDYLIYYASELKSMFKIKKNVGEIELIWKHNTTDYFRSFAHYNDKYIFFPGGFGKIGVVNPNKKEIQYVDMPNKLHLYNEDNWSANYICYKDSLFFYWQNSVITRYNLKTNEWKTYRDWQKDLPANISPNHWMINEAFFYNGNLYFPIGESKHLLEINPENDNVRICFLNIPDNVGGMCVARYSNNNLFILCKVGKNKISVLKSYYFLFEDFKEIAQIPIIPDTIESFSSIVCGNKYLWLFPSYEDKAYRINLTTNEIEISKEIPTVSEENLYGNYNFGFLLQNYYWTINVNTGDLVKIDLLNDKITVIKIKFPVKTYINLLQNTNIFTEDAWNFKDLINKLIINDGGLDQNYAIPNNFFLGNDYGNFDNVVSSCVKKQCVKKDIKSKYDLSQYNENLDENEHKRKWDFLLF